MTAEPASASPRKRELERGRSRVERDSLRQTTTRLGASKKCVHTTPHCWWKQKPGRADRKCEEHASTATKNWADAASGTETFSFSAVIFFFALGVVGGRGQGSSLLVTRSTTDTAHNYRSTSPLPNTPVSRSGSSECSLASPPHTHAVVSAWGRGREKAGLVCMYMKGGGVLSNATTGCSFDLRSTQSVAALLLVTLGWLH